MQVDGKEKLVDARWLEPPEPLERVLAALDTLEPDQCLRFLIHMEPYPLYSILERNGFAHRTEYAADGTVAVCIWREQSCV